MSAIEIPSVGDLVALLSWLPAKDMVADVSAAHLTLAVTKGVLGLANLMSSFKVIGRNGEVSSLLTMVAQMLVSSEVRSVTHLFLVPTVGNRTTVLSSGVKEDWGCHYRCFST